jgi:hypothetical protein
VSSWCHGLCVSYGFGDIPLFWAPMLREKPN